MSMIYVDSNKTPHNVSGLTGDTVPIGTEVDFVGEEIPEGWERVSNLDELYYVPEEKIAGYNGWYLVLSGEITKEYDNHVFILSVQQLFNGQAGELYVNIRKPGAALYIDSFKWLNNTGLNSSEFKLKIDGNSYYLYAHTDWEFKQYQFRVIQVSSLEDNDEDILTFYSCNSSDVVSEPTGTNPIDSNAKTVTLIWGTSMSFEIPVGKHALVMLSNTDCLMIWMSGGGMSFVRLYGNDAQVTSNGTTVTINYIGNRNFTGNAIIS